MDIPIETTTLSLIFDGVLVVAILALWVMWFQQASQRKKVEQLLQQAASELQEATVLLDQVMTQLPKLKEEEPSTVEQPKLHAAEQVVEKKPIQDQVSIGEKGRTLEASPANNQGQNSNFSVQIMRLNREGLSMDEIAKQLHIPVAQVRLMLMLQNPKEALIKP